MHKEGNNLEVVGVSKSTYVMDLINGMIQMGPTNVNKEFKLQPRHNLG